MHRSAIEQPLDLDVTERLRSANQQWCRWLKDAREAEGLSRMQLAERMGYRKLQRGAARIAGWERGDDVPRSDRIPLLAEKLGLSKESVASQAGREEEGLTVLARNDMLLSRAKSSAALFDLQLLGRYGDLLLSRSAEVFDDVAHSGLRVTGAMLVQAYIGGLALSLDELLYEWLAGRFQFPCGHCGATARCYYGGGSPLSGNHKLAGWCGSCEKRVTGRLSPGSPREHKLAHILIGLRKRRQSKPPETNDFTGWTLGQYLSSRFGVTVPDIHVADNAGKTVALYRHQTGVLEGGGGELLGSFWSPAGSWREPAGRHDWQEQWGPSREGGKLVLGSLAPLRAGAWQGESLAIEDDQGRTWQASAGVLYSPSGRPAMRSSGPLPVAVQVRLVEVGTSAGHTQ